jgi:replicative DNA helicase
MTDGWEDDGAPPIGDSSTQVAREAPHNADAEQAFLGACLINARAIDANASINAEHFYWPIHGRIFDALNNMWQGGIAPDPTMIKPMFEQDDGLLAVGGTDYIGRLAQAATTVSGAGQYAGAIIDMWRLRQLSEVADTILDEIDSFDHETDANAILDTAIDGLDGLASDAGIGKSRKISTDLVPELDQVMLAAEVAYKSDGQITGIKTGVPSLDEALSGLNKEELIILAGRPGMGKSSLAVFIATHAARQAPTLLISLEMGKEEIRRRQLSSLSGVEYSNMRRGRLTPEDFQKMAAAKHELAALPTYIDDTPGQTVFDITRQVRRFHRENPLGLVIVDHIGWVRPTDRKMMKVHQVEQVTQELKNLARKLHIPILALSQLSRGVEAREDKRPMLSDLRDSGSIEQDADAVIFLYRYAYYLRQKEPEYTTSNDGAAEHAEWKGQVEHFDRIMDILIRKNRNGPSPMDLKVNCSMGTNHFFDDSIPADETPLLDGDFGGQMEVNFDG